jgi:hypothetical protein
VNARNAKANGFARSWNHIKGLTPEMAGEAKAENV